MEETKSETSYDIIRKYFKKVKHIFYISIVRLILNKNKFSFKKYALNLVNNMIVTSRCEKRGGGGLDKKIYFKYIKA